MFYVYVHVCVCVCVRACVCTSNVLDVNGENWCEVDKFV